MATSFHRCLTDPDESEDIGVVPRSASRLRKRCWAIVRRLPLPEPFSVSALCDSIAADRGRTLYLHPMDRPEGVLDMPCGMWVATDVADHVFFEQQTSTFHQEHIILHELGHMICGHTIDMLDPALVDADNGDEPVQRALFRASYNTEQEQEAELLATLLLERGRQINGESLTESERRLGKALGFGR
jgi:hypothetical protein